MKWVCVGNAFVAIALTGELVAMSITPERELIGRLPPSYEEPHEAPSNYYVPQYQNTSIVINATGTVSSSHPTANFPLSTTPSGYRDIVRY